MLDLPSQEYLRECFNYDEETGDLIWKERGLHHFNNEKSMKASNSNIAGKVAGNLNPNGYITVVLNKKAYKAHRIIWKLVTGKNPIGQIDHIDNTRSNNSWANLRDVEVHVNQANKKEYKSNKSGKNGISFNENSKKWRVRKTVQGIQYFIGEYTNYDDAVNALDVFMANNYIKKGHVKEIPSKPVITLSLLNKLFEYNDGKLIFKERFPDDMFNDRSCNNFNAKWVGKEAGCLNEGGYISVKINHHRFLAHRLIYQICHNLEELPKDMVVDHINSCKTDNSISNLRLVTHSQNSMNTKKLNKKSSEYKGVRRDTLQPNKWRASIYKEGKNYNLGVYKTELEAANAYQKAASELHGEYANFG